MKGTSWSPDGVLYRQVSLYLQTGKNKLFKSETLYQVLFYILVIFFEEKSLSIQVSTKQSRRVKKTF